MARRTAASEPGSTKIALRPTVPAVARVSMAAARISSKLSIRNSSPNPSRRFSSRRSTASNVPSREVMPVPPVVMMTRVAASASWRRTQAATRAGSSRTIAVPEIVCPPPSSSARIARPLVSVSSVRVSLTVTTKQATDAGAWALC